MRPIFGGSRQMSLGKVIINFSLLKFCMKITVFAANLLYIYKYIYIDKILPSQTNGIGHKLSRRVKAGYNSPIDSKQNKKKKNALLIW